MEIFDNFDTYTAKIDLPSDVTDGTSVTGSSVNGLTVKDVESIGFCLLTPGDPSPVGRCPQTGDLVYLDRPIDRLRDAAEKMFEALARVDAWSERQGTLRSGLPPDLRSLVDAALKIAKGERPVVIAEPPPADDERFRTIPFIETANPVYVHQREED